MNCPTTNRCIDDFGLIGQFEVARHGTSPNIEVGETREGSLLLEVMEL